MNPNVGEIWLGTYKYVESKLIDVHDANDKVGVIDSLYDYNIL